MIGVWWLHRCNCLAPTTLVAVVVVVVVCGGGCNGAVDNANTDAGDVVAVVVMVMCR